MQIRIDVQLPSTVETVRFIQEMRDLLEDWGQEYLIDSLENEAPGLQTLVPEIPGDEEEDDEAPHVGDVLTIGGSRYIVVTESLDGSCEISPLLES